MAISHTSAHQQDTYQTKADKASNSFSEENTQYLKQYKTSKGSPIQQAIRAVAPKIAQQTTHNKQSQPHLSNLHHKVVDIFSSALADPRFKNHQEYQQSGRNLNKLVEDVLSTSIDFPDNTPTYWLKLNKHVFAFKYYIAIHPNASKQQAKTAAIDILNGKVDVNALNEYGMRGLLSEASQQSSLFATDAWQKGWVSDRFRNTQQRLDSWVNWSQKSTIDTPQKALNAVLHRYGLSIPESFYNNLTNQPAAALATLNFTQRKALDEAALLFNNANFNETINPDQTTLDSLKNLRANFINALKNEHGFYPVNHGVEHQWEEVGQPFDLHRTALLSVARQLYKEQYGEAETLKLDKSNFTSNALAETGKVLESLSPFSVFMGHPFKKIADKIEYHPNEQYEKILNNFNQAVAEWKPSFNAEGAITSKPHPYARVASYYKQLLHQTAQKLENGKFDFLQSLPNGQAHINELKAEINNHITALDSSSNNAKSLTLLGETLVKLSKAKNTAEAEQILQEARSDDDFGIKNTAGRIAANFGINLITLGGYNLGQSIQDFNQVKPFLNHWKNELSERNRDTFWPQFYLNNQIGNIVDAAASVAAIIASLGVGAVAAPEIAAGEAAGSAAFESIALESAEFGSSELLTEGETIGEGLATEAETAFTHSPETATAEIHELPVNTATEETTSASRFDSGSQTINSRGEVASETTPSGTNQPVNQPATTNEASTQLGVKDAARIADRHNLIHPVEQPELWAKSVTRQRVSDLFRFNPNRADNLTPFTKHWQQIQQEVNRAVNGYSNIATEEGKSAFRDIATAIVKAARHAQFDFPEHTLKFTNDMPWLKIARVNGNLVIRSGQQLIKP
ncbi:hypothetical protein [Spartinivicinus marinus]|uniref:hypothetical protein n=1 Tax=Spartinivicinus marinus TaxID=2994442 RepID=UPI001C5CB8C5|nr:hypothetical protein [Spartinivicinus marinus]MCX4029247.1 hypothetical protein [Spartinivicinus marinus]